MTPQPSPHVGGSLYMRSSTQGTERKTDLTAVLESSQAPFAAVGVSAWWDPDTDARVMCLFARFRTALAGFGCDIDPPWPRLLGLNALLACCLSCFKRLQTPTSLELFLSGCPVLGFALFWFTIVELDDYLYD